MRSCSHTLRALVAVVPDLSEPGGTDILEDLMRLGDRVRLGSCLVAEADVDALALADMFAESCAEELVVFGPRHREGRLHGVYTRTVEPRRPGGDIAGLVRELWPSLTGSLRLDDVVAALSLLLGRRFTVAECEPGGQGCRGVLEEWARRVCG